MHGLTGGGWKRGNLRHRASPLPSHSQVHTDCVVPRQAGTAQRFERPGGSPRRHSTMKDSPMSPITEPHRTPAGSPPSGAAMGLILFAGIMMIMVGVFQDAIHVRR